MADKKNIKWNAFTKGKLGKEALDKLYMAVDEELLYEQSGYIFATELTKPIEQDLERLEQLEKKYQKLEERFKKRAELCSEFAEYISQYEKVLDFFMDKFKLELKGNRLYFFYNNQYFELDKEEEKLMKEVLGYE